MRQTVTMKSAGFTLLELMITVAIIGILAAITIPSYSKYVQKTKRSDAKVELMKIAQMQESYFVQNMSYAQNLTTLGFAADTINSENDNYSVRVSALPANCNTAGNPPCTSFTVNATPISASQTSDTVCTAFQMDNTGRKMAKGGSTSTYTIAQGKKCWK